MIVRVLRFLDAVPHQRVFAYAVGLALAVGAAQYMTHPELSLHVFYLAPIAMASWHVARVAGVGLCALCAGLWLTARLAQLQRSPVPSGLVLWDLGVLFLSFLLVALIVSALRDQLDLERGRARRDPLTGLLNAAAFTERVEHERRQLVLTGRATTVAYLDLDNFKAVNDCSGHAAGDALLRTVATALQTTLRQDDTVARLGGDEFAILLRGDAERTAPVLRKVHAAVAASLAGSEPPVGLSIGGVVFRAPTPSAAAMIHLADQVMYEAKQAGKNRVELRGAPMRTPPEPSRIG